MIVLCYFLYACFCVSLAYKNAEWANPKDKWKIKHWLNATTHLTAASIVGLFYAWYHFFGILLLARIVFDTSLNIFRHFNPFHVSPNPNSWVDKIEKKVFGNSGLVPKLIYLVILLIIWAS